MGTETKTTGTAPVRKTLTVGLAPEQAFQLFTAGVGRWWPLAAHSVGKSSAETAVLEGRVGGRIYERHRDGKTVVWGHVRLWEPPRRIVYSWHPGRGEDTAQEVELRFTPEGTGTRVELEHRGWDVLGKDAQETREDYDKGWNFVLTGCFGKLAAAQS